MKIICNHHSVIVCISYRFLLLGLAHQPHKMWVAPKRRNPLKKKDVIVTSTTMATLHQVRRIMMCRVLLKQQAAKRDTFQRQLSQKLNKRIQSCSQKQCTKSSNITKVNQPLKNVRSRRRNESEVESSAIENTRSKRLSKTKATSQISGHFEQLHITPPY